MRTRRSVRLQALLLAVLTGALASGVPSHHHERDDQGPILVNAGYHGHGTQLVEQGERQTSELVVVALPASVVLGITQPAPTFVVAPFSAPRPLARGQPPPTDLPRAPPVHA